MLTLNLPGVFGIAAAALALMLFVKIAVSPAVDRTGKYLLLFFLGGLLAMAINSLYFLLGLHLQWPHLSFLWFFAMAWIGPAFWLYTARVLGLAVVPTGWPSSAHWMPGILLQLGMLPYMLQSAETKLNFIYSDTGKWVFSGVHVFIYVQIAVYILLCQRALSRHRAQSAATEEKEELRTDLTWINVVSFGFASFLILDGLLPHLRLTSPGASYTVALGQYLFITAAVFHASAHGRVYPFVSTRASANSRYANSALRDDTARYYVDKLSRLTGEQKPYLDGDLSLDKLAALLRIHPHHLSQLLNDHMGKNFYDYINEQRIAHARRLLLEQPELPVVDVAIASGYNNKNSFYNSFRRFVGMTPSAYRQQGVRNTSAAPEAG
jgi:AraC-like DNA-binding protein